MALKEDYKDAVFAGLRKYKMLDNGDGTVSPVDMTEYETAGDKFGAKDVNAITKMVNCTGDAFDPGRDYEAEIIRFMTIRCGSLRQLIRPESGMRVTWRRREFWSRLLSKIKILRH